MFLVRRWPYTFGQRWRHTFGQRWRHTFGRRWRHTFGRNRLLFILILAFIFCGNAFFVTRLKDQREDPNPWDDRENEIVRMVKAFDTVDDSDLQRTMQKKLKESRQRFGNRQSKFHATWVAAERGISSQGLYHDNKLVASILRALATAPIISVDVLGQGETFLTGTSYKWLLTLEGGQLAVFKPMWERKGDQKPTGSCNAGFESPSAEIAAFHLHRVFGFNNTPFVSGRRLNITSEILPVATNAVKSEIYHREGTEYCISGMCFQCKSSEDVCHKDGVLEGAVIYWIPKLLMLHTLPPLYHPFATTNMKEWMKFGDNTYCLNIPEKMPFYADKNRYLDIFDFAVMDYLMHHFDSKHHTLKDKKGLSVRLDFGRAFCSYDLDRDDILLEPLRQCCTLRRSTWERLRSLQKGVGSKELLRFLRSDALNPVLHDQFYKAITRRITKAIQTIQRCGEEKGGLKNVLVDEL